ncbi:MAG TPA: Mu transposase C-terminal domain-containing protein [Pyrinomonadaceae bacterium]
MIAPFPDLQQSSDRFEREVWLSVDEIVALGKSRRRVLLRISDGKWKSRDAGTGQNGKPARVVALSSLPADLQRRWAEQQRAIAVDLAISEAPAEAKPAGDGLDQLTQALSNYPADEREAWIAEALRLNDLVDRYEAINPKRTRLPGTATLDFVPAVKALCKEAICTNQIILEALAKRSRRAGCKQQRAKQVSPHTLDQWARQRRQQGLLTFIRSRSAARKADDGRLADATPAALEWLETQWRLHPIPSQLYEKWERLAAKNNWKIPSLTWLRRRWRHIPEVAKTAIFQGDKAYTGKFKPHLIRSFEDLEALQILCGDHHVLDVFCWSDKLKKALRLWLTAWQDMRTGLIWGFHLDYTPSSHTIGCAYAKGVRDFGAQPPSRDGYRSAYYVDNGKDYRSRNINGEIEVHRHAAAVDGGLQLLLTERGVGLASDADIDEILARAFNGREKPIERTFNDLANFVQDEFFKTGWCGRDAKNKPDAYRDLYARHVKAMKHKRPSPFLHEDVIRLAIAEWVQRYNAKQHTRGTLDGATVIPLEEYARLYTNRYDIREETLALMAMMKTTGTLHKNGVKAFGSSYWHNEMSIWKGRKGEDGKALQVEVRYLDNDYTVVWIVLPNGHICEAQRVDISSVLTPNKNSLKALADRTRKERELINNYRLLNESVWRGETVEDRVVAEMPPEDVVEMPLPIAVGENAQIAQSRVTMMTRLDTKRHRAPVTRLVSVADVASIEADENIFSDAEPSSGSVKEFDDE